MGGQSPARHYMSIYTACDCSGHLSCDHGTQIEQFAENGRAEEDFYDFFWHQECQTNVGAALHVSLLLE